MIWNGCQKIRSKKPDTERDCPASFTRCARRRTLQMDINFWENVLFLTAIFPDHFQKIPRMLRQIPVFPIGGDGSCESRSVADGEAEGAVSGVLVFMVEIALRGEGSADAVHSQMDRHGGVSRVERDQWIDVVLLKEIQSDAAGVLVRVEENEVFLF